MLICSICKNDYNDAECKHLAHDYIEIIEKAIKYVEDYQKSGFFNTEYFIRILNGVNL